MKLILSNFKKLFFRTSKSSIGPSIGPQIEVPDAFKEVEGVASDKWDGWVIKISDSVYIILKRYPWRKIIPNTVRSNNVYVTNMETRDNATEKIKAKLDEIFWPNSRTLHQMHQLF